MRCALHADWPSGAAREALRAGWEALLPKVAGASVFQTFAWQEAWWAAFGAGRQLLLLTVHTPGDELAAIAPLMIEPGRQAGIRERRLMLIGTSNHAADYADLIVARQQPRARAAIVEWIAAHRQRWSSMELRNVPESSPTLQLLRNVPGLPRALLQFSAQAPALRLGDAAADRRAANKKSLRRHYNGFAREQPVRLQRIDEAAQLDAHLEAFFAQHIGRWRGTDTPSLFHDPAQQVFYRVLAARLRATGQLHFTAVYWGEQVIAYHFGFERDGVLTWYKPSFDAALAQRSPGEVLIKLLLDHAIERGLREVDFTVGSEQFKFRFANVVRQVCRLRMHRRAWQRWPAHAREWLKRRWLALRGARLRRSPGAAPSGAGTPPARSA